MPLLPRPLPGDLADRQSILELKIQHSNVDEFNDDQKGEHGKTKGTVNRVTLPKGSANPKTVQFIEEHALILKAIQANFTLDLQNNQMFQDKYDAKYSELAEVNATLWKLEDEIRALKAAPVQDKIPRSSDRGFAWLHRVKDTAFDIVVHNDKRSELIKQINAMWHYTTNEKLY